MNVILSDVVEKEDQKFPTIDTMNKNSTNGGKCSTLKRMDVKVKTNIRDNPTKRI